MVDYIAIAGEGFQPKQAGISGRSVPAVWLATEEPSKPLCLWLFHWPSNDLLLWRPNDNQTQWDTRHNCYPHLSIQSPYRQHGLTKKRGYGDRIREIENDSFTPLVFATTGGMGRESTSIYKLTTGRFDCRWIEYSILQDNGMDKMHSIIFTSTFGSNMHSRQQIQDTQSA